MLWRICAAMVVVVLTVVGCEAMDVREENPLEPILPQFSLEGGGEAWVTGPSYITEAGSYFYSVCTSGLNPGEHYWIPLETCWDEEFGDGLIYPPSSTCYGDYLDVYVSRNFAVMGSVFRADTTPIYKLGDTEPYPVVVDFSYPLSVEITGSEQIAPNEECSWQAVVAGGETPFSYHWWGALSGSSQTVEGSLSASSYLWVAVTDGASSADTAQVLIQVDEQYECEW